MFSWLSTIGLVKATLYTPLFVENIAQMKLKKIFRNVHNFQILSDQNWQCRGQLERFHTWL